MWNRWKSACREAVASINRCMIIIIVHLITLERNQIFDKRQKSRFVKETMQRNCNRLYKLINKEMISRSDKSKYAKEAEYIIDRDDKSLLFQLSEIMQTLKINDYKWWIRDTRSYHSSIQINMRFHQVNLGLEKLY